MSVDVTPLPPDHPLCDGRTTQAPLIRALRGDRPERLPVWFMRQAGRSLPEYRKARAGIAMLDACLRPELASELTVQPVRRHGVDAAIFFSDIVVPLKLAGVGVDIKPGVGPVLDQPYRTADDIARLTEHELTDEALTPIRDGVAHTIALLDEHAATMEAPTTPLIGFGGAPFTLAAYLVEGKPSRDHLAARALMHTDPDSWRRLMAWTADLTGRFLHAQVVAGASAVQLFDSWAGSLSKVDYDTHVAWASTDALSHVADLRIEPVVPSSPGGVDLGVPAIHFGVGAGHLLTSLRDVVRSAGLTSVAVGVDYRTPLDEAIDTLGPNVVVQGNIDPARLAAPWPVLEAHVRDVIERGRHAVNGQAPGHVVNLGHGVPPETDPEVLTRIVELIHQSPE
ncbi:MAG: uroporphyrinogen decarboxylase [Propionibacteriaceae bacterium]|nr:uroporphyrinogen decarboxylase [Propionibacteriaceae bacterium]